MVKPGIPAENAGKIPKLARRKPTEKSASYTANRNKRVDEGDAEMEKYPGWYVARSLDGEITHAYAPAIPELREHLHQLGLRLPEVMVECIPTDSVELPLGRDVDHVTEE